ncbi:hypothetical protein [Micromonospora endolithica]|uniref:DNA primase n=1 Tax=Micromonospora endolithica TaxID=230091 RepID=A0A3A9YS69_9ACTN|nr:hypothetical protein [Micromonospora endolithica]RKN38908.1 hypothetical protein D7223_30215 [Micromonospora endolithica]TWJ25538.1 hypothetical protein JD76_05711 [Micromonospora endolithica]
MNSGARIGVAVGVGYLLGRRRKLRKALVLAAAVAAGRASQNPGGLTGLGSRLLQSSPQLSNLSRLGGPLVSASKNAATAAAGSGIDAVSGRLRGSADSLRRRGGSGRSPDRPDDDHPDNDQADDDQATNDQPEGSRSNGGRPANGDQRRGR